jgi:hypothetical protein
MSPKMLDSLDSFDSTVWLDHPYRWPLRICQSLVEDHDQLLGPSDSHISRLVQRTLPHLIYCLAHSIAQHHTDTHRGTHKYTHGDTVAHLSVYIPVTTRDLLPQSSETRAFHVSITHQQASGPTRQARATRNARSTDGALSDSDTRSLTVGTG